MFSSNVLKDDLFPKKIALEYDFSCCIIWKDDISFSRKYDFIRKTENERKPFSKKIHGNIIFSSNVPKRWLFKKKKSRWNMILLELSGKMVSFSWKISCFFIGRKMKNDLSQETHGNIIFFCIYV